MGIDDDLREFQRQLEAGSIRRAYVALLAYMAKLRSEFASGGDVDVSGLYQGSFDMTYFAVSPPMLKARGLKIAVVFDYAPFRFQVWLAARNRTVQRRYFDLFTEHGWDHSALLQPAPGVDAIAVRDVASGLDLADQALLTRRLGGSVAGFTVDLEQFLGLHDGDSV